MSDKNGFVSPALDFIWVSLHPEESAQMIRRLEFELEKVKAERDRLGVLAIKLCDINHPDWDEIVKLTAFLEEDK